MLLVRYKLCEYCKEYYLPRLDKVLKGRFCSTDCSHSFMKKENHPSWDGGATKVICRYCNEQYKVPICRIKTSKYCSKKCKNLYQSIYKRGINSARWKGDKALTKKERDRKSIKYIEWRKSVYIRDNYTCQLCKYKKGGYLEAHHILKYSKYPKMRFDVNNGITLCKDCHNKTKSHEENYEDLFQKIVSQN